MHLIKPCLYCGDDLIPAHKDFGICGWCLKTISDNQKKVYEQRRGYFNGDRDEFKGEVDYG